MTKRQQMKIENVSTASHAFECWFSQYPGVANPCDINSKEKYNFAMRLLMLPYGLKIWRDMLRARKNKSGADWGKYGYWESRYPRRKGVPETKLSKTSQELYIAPIIVKNIYGIYFEMWPKSSNPLDLDTRQGAAFFRHVPDAAALKAIKPATPLSKASLGYLRELEMLDVPAWKIMAGMLAARKEHTAANKFPNPWIKCDYWLQLRNEVTS